MHIFFRGNDGVMAKRWDKETQEKAVGLVIDHRSDYSSEWAAITTVAARLGMSAKTLRKWVRQSRVQRQKPFLLNDVPWCARFMGVECGDRSTGSRRRSPLPIMRTPPVVAGPIIGLG